jgi:hypothetical protein
MITAKHVSRLDRTARVCRAEASAIAVVELEVGEWRGVKWLRARVPAWGSDEAEEDPGLTKPRARIAPEWARRPLAERLLRGPLYVRNLTSKAVAAAMRISTNAPVSAGCHAPWAPGG